MVPHESQAPHRGVNARLPIRGPPRKQYNRSRTRDAKLETAPLGGRADDSGRSHKRIAGSFRKPVYCHHLPHRRRLAAERVLHGIDRVELALRCAGTVREAFGSLASGTSSSFPGSQISRRMGFSREHRARRGGNVPKCAYDVAKALYHSDGLLERLEADRAHGPRRFDSARTVVGNEDLCHCLGAEVRMSRMLCGGTMVGTHRDSRNCGGVPDAGFSIPASRRGGTP